MDDRLAAARFILMGKRSSREYPQAKNSVRDHKSDCAPVSAMAETVAWVSWVGLVPFLRVEAPLSSEMVINQSINQSSPSPLTLGEDVMVELCEWVVASSAVRGRGTSAAVRDGGASFSGLK